MGFAMGSVTTSVRISNPHNGAQLDMLDLLIDTGATFTVLPFQSLKQLGVKPRVKRRLRTADGRIVERDGATVLLEIMGKADEVPVVFGKEKDTPVLGITTLEILGFELDPVKRQLRPSEYLFLQARG
jgi:clan AA aspartic protease